VGGGVAIACGMLVCLFYFLPFSHFAHKLYSFFFTLPLNGMSACVKNLDPKVNFLCLLSLPFLRLTFLTRRQLFIACITYLSKLTLLSSHRRAHHNLTEKAKINH
jgi:hypothetical protein